MPDLSWANDTDERLPPNWDELTATTCRVPPLTDTENESPASALRSVGNVRVALLLAAVPSLNGEVVLSTSGNGPLTLAGRSPWKEISVVAEPAIVSVDGITMFEPAALCTL